MGISAYPMIEKEFEGHTWKRMSSDDSFSLYGLDDQEEDFLRDIDFYHWLGDECTGYTETCIENVEEALSNLRPEERYRIRELVDIIKKDMNYGYIQYNVG